MLQDPDNLVFGSVFVEVIAPAGSSAPDIPGWQLRAWPQARLGDLTLEAWPLQASSPQALLGALRAAGYIPLGARVKAAEHPQKPEQPAHKCPKSA